MSTSTGPTRVREARVDRSTKETKIKLTLDVDGGGTSVDIATGIPFYDHMLHQLARHGGMNLALHCEGDIEVDTHHTVEDCGIALGEAFRQALGDKAGVRRFANTSVPLDEALVDVSVDLSGRPFLYYGVEFPCEVFLLGEPGFDPQLAEEFWRAFSTAAAITLHISMVRGANTHHILEASFKAAARAIRDAVRVEGTGVPSTKGVL